MDALGSADLPVRDVLTDALRYWEKRRVAYNLVLILVVFGSIALNWPQSRSLIRFIMLLPLFMLAVIANICYSVAYMVDVPVQLSGFRAAWQRWRWVLSATAPALLYHLRPCRRGASAPLSPRPWPSSGWETR